MIGVDKYSERSSKQEIMLTVWNLIEAINSTSIQKLYCSTYNHALRRSSTGTNTNDEIEGMNYFTTYEKRAVEMTSQSQIKSENGCSRNDVSISN